MTCILGITLAKQHIWMFSGRAIDLGHVNRNFGLKRLSLEEDGQTNVGMKSSHLEEQGYAFSSYPNLSAMAKSQTILTGKALAVLTRA